MFPKFGHWQPRVWFSHACRQLLCRGYISALVWLRRALLRQTYQSFLLTVLWFTLTSSLREHEMGSFCMKHELEDVIQRSSGLSGYLIRLEVVQRKTPRNSRTVGTDSQNRCFTVQICSSWALLLPSIDIATELLPDQNTLTHVPLQMRGGVFSGKALIFTYCVIKKRIVLSLSALFMLIQSVSLTCVFLNIFFTYFSLKTWLYISPLFVSLLSMVFYKDLWCHF